jgi:hypothetical protein
MSLSSGHTGLTISRADRIAAARQALGRSRAEEEAAINVADLLSFYGCEELRRIEHRVKELLGVA